MQPIFLVPSIGLTWVGEQVSVRPYPSTSLPPEIRSKVTWTSSGRGAAPLVQYLIDLRSYLGRSLKLLMAAYIVGTPQKIVGRCLSAAFITAGRSRGLGTRIIAAPRCTPMFMTQVIPKLWKSGSAPISTSRPGFLSGNQASVIAACAIRLRCVSMAPLETPVVPPV